jgi:hypothetical protein
MPMTAIRGSWDLRCICLGTYQQSHAVHQAIFECAMIPANYAQTRILQRPRSKPCKQRRQKITGDMDDLLPSGQVSFPSP